MRFTQTVPTAEKVKLDLIDKKILYHLSENARTPYTKIAKKVRLSKDAVKYRIKNLERKGVIQGYVTVIDISKLGFGTYHMFVQLKKVNLEARRKTISTLKSYPFVKVVIEFSGKYDFEIGIAARDIEELDERVSTIVDEISASLHDFELLIISKNFQSRNFPRSFIDMPEHTAEAKPATVDVDPTDLKLLGALSKNAVMPLYEMGRLIHLTPDAAKYRIRKLVAQGIIKRFMPIINYSIVGYTLHAVFMNIFNMSKGKEKTLAYFLSTNPHILWAVKTIGKYNLLMYITIKESSELHDTMIKLREMFSPDIMDYESIIAYEEYVYNYFPDICEKVKGK